MTTPDLDRPGPWQALFPHALTLMAHLEAQVPGATWTFGGGTVLMLRIGHRHSKDIDLFVADPQALGWVNPRLSELAEYERLRAQIEGLRADLGGDDAPGGQG